MDDLANFVKTRLDELELFAQSQVEGLPDEYVGDMTPVQSAAMYILADIAAKRHRLERYLAQDGRDLPDGVADGRDPDEAECDEATKGTLEDEVCEDAAIWDYHPDYQAKWAP